MKKLKKNNAINLREDINLLIKNQAIELSLKSKGLKQQKCEDEIDEEKDENIERLKYFRKFGKIEEKKKFKILKLITIIKVQKKKKTTTHLT